MSKANAVKIGGVNERERESKPNPEKKRVSQRVKDYFFAPKFHFSRFTFNLVAVFFITIGLIAGSYLTLKGITSLFAINDTAKTWTFSTATAGDYTYDSTLVTVDNSGAHPVANKLTNTSFETDLSSWSSFVTATGGTIATSSGYTIHTFLSSGTFTPNGTGNVEYLVVGGGGGGGGGQRGGGGGAGGFRTATGFTVTAQAYTVTVGNGGAGGVDTVKGSSGDDSIFSTITSIGGGGGGSRGSTNGANGGSGGGAATGAGGAPGTKGTGTAGQGNDGGAGTGAAQYGTGGGGGASAVGADGTTSTGGNGGAGSSSSISGSSVTYAGGGGGTSWAASGAGGSGGGGGGGGGAGSINTGGGGGGSTATGGAGGSGIVIIKYPNFTATIDTATTYNNSAGSAKLVNDSIAQNFTQSVNVGDTNTYNLSAYAYTDGSAVTSSDVELFYNDSTVSTTYTSVGSGWYQLTGTLTGANASREYGVLVKAGKTVKVDDFTLSKQGTYSVYTTSAYSNAQVNTWDTFCEGTLVGSTCTTDATYSGNSAIKYQICTDDGSTCQSGSSWKWWNGSAWATATDTTTTVNTAAQLTQAVMQALPIASQKISVKAIFTFGGSAVPYLPHISIGLTTDTTAPTTNASAIAMTRSNGGTTVASNGWTKNDSPYFSWTAGADNSGGSGVKGYCLYLGTDTDGNPATAKGLLGTSPVSTAGTTCQFIVSGTSVDLATSGYIGTALTTSSSPYYLNIKAVDNAGNIIASSTQFQFRFDNTAPTSVTYISCASGSFANVADMSFNWPTSGAAASSDSNAGLLGWQYQINSTAGTWLGSTTEALLGVTNYIPSSESSRTLTSAQDGSAIVSGNNIIYFRTEDAAGNTSSDATIRTCNLSYGGAAPTFGGSDTVTVTPSTSTSNSYALSWPAATATSGQTVAHYYYMINTSPPSTLATLQGNASTYIDTTTTRTVSATALANVNKGTNTVYVVAIDNAATPNYSPSNYISGTFTLSSTDPDNVGSLVASDSSIKASSQWNVTLTWVAPTYQGAGNLTYLVKRSTDNSTFTQVGTTTGLSYVDNTPSSAKYYYKVYTKDGANAESSGTNAVSITPTGKWTTAPTLDSGPTAGSLTTKKATITWSTSRSADSKIQYGTTSGSYSSDEVSNSSQVSSHTVNLTNLKAGTTYYYKAKWTDEDGNTGTSDEKTFTTTSAPTAKNVSVTSIGLTSGLINYTVTNASSVKIYYGTTTSFGGTTTVSTSTSETAYTTQLTGLLDGTKYYYKINSFDSDSNEYEGTVLDFTTLPRPKITNVRIQQVANTAQSTILVTWTTNTEVSSIITYYPDGKTGDASDEVNVALTRGDHRMIVRSLLPQTDYILVVKGRDKIGNEATSDSQRLTTATDTRPPQISELHVEGSNIPAVSSTAQEQTAQLIVSWNTDEPGTAQVEFGEGTGTTYAQKTQEDSNLTFNHIVIISNLTPSKVYHLRAISKDKAGNMGNSIDTVTITPKATENAFNLVITNLQAAFGFLGGLNK